jgi:hypothetical protein
MADAPGDPAEPSTSGRHTSVRVRKGREKEMLFSIKSSSATISSL